MGGIGPEPELDLFDNIEEVIRYQIFAKIDLFERCIVPSYLLDAPYRNLLIAVARGDGKLLNVFRRARISEVLGGELISELVEKGILYLEESRESPLKAYPKQKIKKHLRSYRIQPKARFSVPFYRFWFGFVEPYMDSIEKGNTHAFLDNFNQHRDRCASLVFEQLSNDLLAHYFSRRDPFVSGGSFWDRYSEFDILCTTESGKVILGECKFTGRKVCKNELNKLKEKAANSGISVDIYALFSKNGFSNELKQMEGEKLLLFESDDFRQLAL